MKQNDKQLSQVEEEPGESNEDSKKSQVYSLKDLKVCLALFNQMERVYTDCKLQINQMDFESLDGLVQAENVRTALGLLEQDATEQLNELKQIEEDSKQMTDRLCQVKAKFSLVHDQFINKSMNLFSLAEIQALTANQAEVQQSVQDLFSSRPSDKMDGLTKSLLAQIQDQEKEKQEELDTLKDQIKSKLDDFESLLSDADAPSISDAISTCRDQLLELTKPQPPSPVEDEDKSVSEQCLEAAQTLQNLRKNLSDAKKLNEKVNDQSLGQKAMDAAEKGSRDRNNMVEKVLNKLEEVRGEAEGLEAQLNDAKGILDTTDLNVKQNIAKISASLKTVQEQCKLVSDECTQSPPLKQIENFLNSLGRLDQIDLGSVRQSMEELLKQAKKVNLAQIHEENKKNQVKISNLKKDLNSYQKRIPGLNQRVDEVGKIIIDMQDKFTTLRDFEKECELNNQLIGSIEEIEKQINRLDTFTSKTWHEQSLVELKKSIIVSLNRQVNEFNTNNQKYKDEEKAAKAEGRTPNYRLLEAVAAASEVIKAGTKDLDDLITFANGQADEVNIKLDRLQFETIPQFQTKYIARQKVINKCENLVESILMEIQKEKANLAAKLIEVNDRIEACRKNGDTAGLKEAESAKSEILQNRHQIEVTSNLIQEKINEIDEMETSLKQTEELVNVYDYIKQINLNLEYVDHAQSISVDRRMIHSLNTKAELDKHLKDAQASINKQQSDLNQINADQSDLVERLEQVKLALKDAKEKKDLMKNAEYQMKCGQIQKEIDLVDMQVKAIVKREQALTRSKQQNQQFKQKLEKQATEVAHPSVLLKDLQMLFDSVDRTNLEVAETSMDSKDANQRLSQIEQEIIDLLGFKSQKQKLHSQVQELAEQLGDDMGKFEATLNQNNHRVKMMAMSCEEMMKDTSPDFTADYWEEKNIIQSSQGIIGREKVRLVELRAIYDTIDGQIKTQMELIRQGDTQTAVDGVAQLQQIRGEILATLEKAYDCQDELITICNLLGQCEIPSNIEKRKNEIWQLEEKMGPIYKELSSLKKTAADSRKEQSSKDLEIKIEQQLSQFEAEKQKIFKFLNDKLVEKCIVQDLACDKNYQIVSDVRTLKEMIKAATKQHDLISESVQQLSRNIMDADNANGILDNKVDMLTDRLKKVKLLLDKVGDTTAKMSGNTSTNEEDELVETVNEELPGLHDKATNLSANLEQIKERIKSLNRNSEQPIDVSVALVKISQEIQEIDELMSKVENELVELNPNKKLSKREKEIHHMHQQVTQSYDDLEDETAIMERELEMLEANEQSSPNIPLIRQYLDEITVLMQDISEFENQLQTLTQFFEEQLPQHLKRGYESRQASDKMSSYNNPFKPNESQGGSYKVVQGLNETMDGIESVYDCLNLNSTFKPMIKECQAQLEPLMARKDQIYTNSIPLKEDLLTRQNGYKADKTDQVDVMMAEALHRRKSSIGMFLRRISPGTYMLGNRQIISKIMHGKLVIRVGGGYMLIDEFINQYSNIEHLKLRNSLHRISNDGKPQTERSSVVSLNDFKDFFRKSLINIEKNSPVKIESPNKSDFNSPVRQPHEGYIVTNFNGLKLKSQFESKLKSQYLTGLNDSNMTFNQRKTNTAVIDLPRQKLHTSPRRSNGSTDHQRSARLRSDRMDNKPKRSSPSSSR